MKNVRIQFEKKGSACYISHLDMTRCMSRALKLSGLPVWYTEGYNPRIYMTFAMPLSLGMQGNCEFMDIRLLEDIPFEKVVESINAHLPEDIHLVSAADPVHDFKEITFADYELTLFSAEPAALADSLRSLLAQDEILVMKHGKKGDKQIDIKPDFAAAELTPQSDSVKISLRLPCGVTGSLNPGLLVDALKAHKNLAPRTKITRLRMFLQDGGELC